MAKVPFGTLDHLDKFYSTRYGIWCFKISPARACPTRRGDFHLSFDPDELVTFFRKSPAERHQMMKDNLPTSPFDSDELVIA